MSAERNDAAQDAAYIAGAQAGYRFGLAGDLEGLNKIFKSRAGYLKTLRACAVESEEDATGRPIIPNSAEAVNSPLIRDRKLSRAAEPPTPTEQFPAGSQGGGGFTDHMSFPKIASEPPTPTEGLYEAIAHGDERHRAWLKAALEAWFAGKPVPPPDTIRPSEPGREARDAVLEEAALVCDQSGMYNAYQCADRIRALKSSRGSEPSPASSATQPAKPPS